MPVDEDVFAQVMGCRRCGDAPAAVRQTTRGRGTALLLGLALSAFVVPARGARLGVPPAGGDPAGYFMLVTCFEVV